MTKQNTQSRTSGGDIQASRRRRGLDPFKRMNILLCLHLFNFLFFLFFLYLIITNYIPEYSYGTNEIYSKLYFNLMICALHACMKLLVCVDISRCCNSVNLSILLLSTSFGLFFHCKRFLISYAFKGFICIYNIFIF